MRQGARERDEKWMRRALAEAEIALAEGEVPVGAVLVCGDEEVAAGHNRRENDFDPTAHAEMLVLRAAGQVLGRWRLTGCTLYVTLEPCPMCAAAITLARVERVVFACDDPQVGAVYSVFDLLRHPVFGHSPAVTAGVLAEEAEKILRHFFNQLRRGAGAVERGGLENR
ncbi:MAG: nucleoside deaminase [Limnochordales bacterium]|nr:nucleoside deaminase [Limnochordales bacterium]